MHYNTIKLKICCMKKQILFLTILFFLAMTFSSNPPPGWFIQQLPVNDLVNDIFFLDSLNGWLVTDGSFNGNDTSYIMSTTNGGDNWTIQNSKKEKLTSIQFLDMNTGYAAGGSNGTTAMSIYKTTNAGINWQALNNITGIVIDDLFFVNKDTGWVCEEDFLFGGLYKTTTGGLSWQRQLNTDYQIEKIFFLNKDTGWIGNNEGILYMTTSGGMNWQQVYNFPGIFRVLGMQFVNSNTGWLTTTAIYKSTNGGLNWEQYGGSEVGAEYSFVSSYTGWASGDNYRVVKTTNGGINWLYQLIPIENSLSISAVDSLKAWGGGLGVIHTTDGGLTGIETITEVANNFILHQNYPNPFNPTTKISYELQSNSNVSLIIYDISGRVIKELVNQNQLHGEYSYTFDGTGLSSGVYFYHIVIHPHRGAFASDKLSTENFTETKKMILAK